MALSYSVYLAAAATPTAQTEDITADVLSLSITGRGITSISPTNRVATPAKLTMELNNSGANQNAQEGYYNMSNGSSAIESGGAVQVVVTDGTYTKSYIFYIDNLVPSAGKYRARRAKLTASDIMKQVHGQKIDKLDVLQDKSPAEMFDALVDHLVKAPNESEYQSGLNDFVVAFHELRDDSDTVAKAMGNVCRTSYGRVMLMCGTNGEKIKYFNRAHFGGILPGTEDITFNETMIDLQFGNYEKRFINRFMPKTPIAKVGTSNVVLWTLQEEISIDSAETIVIDAYYTDPATGERVSALDIQALVSGTDYKMSSVSGSESGDLNASLLITKDSGPNAVEFTLPNAAFVRGHVKPLQIRGKTITTYDAVSKPSINASLGRSSRGSRESATSYDAPYWKDPLHLEVLGDRLEKDNDYSQQIKYIDFYASSNATVLANFLQRDLCDTAKVIETIKDYDTNANDYFYIVGENISIQNNHLFVRWYLDAEPSETYFAADGTDILVNEDGDPFYCEQGIWQS